MDLPLAARERVRVEAFQRKHHVRLLALVFTDIVGSTNLKRTLGDLKAVELIQAHHATVREIVFGFSEGEEISTGGDSFFLIFTKPSDAVKFALLLQSRLRAEFGPTLSIALEDRVGVHVGEVLVEESADSPGARDLYGIQVDTCWRVTSLAQGNQILLTRSAFDHARQALKGQDLQGIGPLSWLNHGAYNLKGLEEPVEICEVGEEGRARLRAPSDGEKASRQVAVGSETVLGWRPAIGSFVPNTRWVLKAKLGEGGFGEAWLGYHAELNHPRVFKFCFRADRVRSLKREVAIFRLLKERLGEHPNIVGVQDLFFEQPPFYLLMDYGEERDLKKWCEEQGGIDSVPIATRLEIVAQVADGLQAAHQAGVLHRDIKPSNILVSRRSPAGLQAKLTDFGIGQLISQETLAGFTRGSHTKSATLSGSPDTGTLIYMAPELLAGKAASVHSDIYSLGVVLLQLVAGDFGQPVTTDWTRHVADPLLAQDLAKCLAGDAGARYASAAELASNLRSLEARRAALARQAAAQVARETAARRRQKALRLAMAAAVVTAAVALGVYTRSTMRLDAQHQQIAREATRRAEIAQNQQRELQEKQRQLDELLAKTVAELNGLRAQAAAAQVSQASAVSGVTQLVEQARSVDNQTNLVAATAARATTNAAEGTLAGTAEVSLMSDRGSTSGLPADLRLAGRPAVVPVSAPLPHPTLPEPEQHTNALVAARLGNDPNKHFYEIETALLFNVLKYVEWPSAALDSQSKTISIAMLGDSPLRPALEVLNAKTVDGRTLVVTNTMPASETLRVLFISPSMRDSLKSILDSIKGQPVLLVGDTPGFAQKGVMVNFGQENNRALIEVNVEAAARAGFKFDSRLLRLARTVR